jgi:hypothetical protein
MATNMDTGTGKGWNKLRVAAWVGAAALWLAPLVGMQFPATGFNWTLGDFVVFGAMLLLALGAFEVGLRMSPDPWYRAGVAVAVGAGFVMVWANLAVGIIGDGDNLANVAFFGVLLVGMAGALVAWFRPAGMARALYATAAANAALSVVCLAAGWDYRGALLSLFFVLPWLLSAGLVRQAARTQG